MNKNRGFTLIELMIVVAVIGILAAIALPSYRTYVLQSKRTTAITAVLELASREARFYTINNAYSNSMTALGYSSSPMPLPSTGTTVYNLNVTTSNSNANFAISATPTGNQTADACGTFTYNDLGVRGNSASTVSNCWKQ